MHHLVTIVAKYFIVLVLLIALFAWLKLDRKRKSEFIVIGILAGILAVILAKLGSHIFYDSRPFVTGHFVPYFPHSSDNGFPSDHTLLGALVAFVTLKYNRSLGSIALLLAILVGVARVVAGVHHLLDIVGSIIIAAVGYVIADALLTWQTRNRAQPRHDRTPENH